MGQGETSLEVLREARGLLESARLENPRSVSVLKGLHAVYSAMARSLYGLGRIGESLASIEQVVPIEEEMVRIEPQVIDNRPTWPAASTTSRSFQITSAATNPHSRRTSRPW